MSNKTQLQTNNTKYASLIETLRGKAVSTGEDLDAELTAQETLISQLGTILDNKAGGSSGLETYTGKLVAGSSIGLGYEFVLNYTNNNLEAVMDTTTPFASEYVFTVPKNTIIFISATQCTATSGCTLLGGGYGAFSYLITGNNFVITAPM